MNSKKRLSLDTNVLLDLAGGSEVVHDFRETFQTKGYRLFVVPTVAEELAFLRLEGNEEQRGLAHIVLVNAEQWALTPLSLPTAAEPICEKFACRLIEKCLIPLDEFNDGLILAETSFLEIPGLVTSDHHLTDIEPSELNRAFAAAELPLVTVFHPKRLLRAIY
ncbi:MAG: hypothetical protein HY735_32705 [Verrucomicrobia bacterium]|nr:hypothetical protein [Verrucomicrobiota bacterium]